MLFWLFAVSRVLAETTPPFRIALVGPFTGVYAAYGTQLLSGASEAINALNLNGGIKNTKLEVIPVDDQCDPSVAITQAEKIIADKNFHAVIGHVCSAATLATINLYAKANMLVITPSSTNPQITQRGITTLFRMIGTDKQQSQVATNFIVHKLHLKRVAVLHDNELYSHELADLVSEHLLQLNTSPILYQAIPRGARNFTSIVKKLKKLNADGVYFAGLYPEVSALATALDVLQLQVPLISSDSIALKQYVTATNGHKVAGATLFTFGVDPHTLVSSKKVIHAMQRKHLETNGYALYAYAAVQVISKTIEETNSTDGKILANYLHHNEIETVLGKKSWDTNGDISDANFNIYAWNNHSELTLINK